MKGKTKIQYEQIVYSAFETWLIRFWVVSSTASPHTSDQRKQ